MAHNEQVFTPIDIVSNILDEVDYVGDNIRNKHIMDIGFGKGAFLFEIIRRYIEVCKREELTDAQINYELSTYIHGIEVDETLYKEVYDELSKRYPDIQFDIRCGDVLTITEYNDKMDYVVGNPPYCKVHDLNDRYDNVKKFKFTQNGMTDLYLAFFEVGLNMLCMKGTLGYITPSSWLTSLAANKFRKYIIDNDYLEHITHFGGELKFKGVTTFTAITILHKSTVECRGFSFYLPDKVGVLPYDEAFIHGKLYLGTEKELKTLREILNNSSTYHKIKVKNGFATLNDKLFIHKNGKLRKNFIPVIKASTGELHVCFFPYDKKGKHITFDRINENTLSYMYGYADGIKMKFDEDDYLFGRTQGIKDVYCNKYCISNLVNDNIDSIKLNEAPAGTGVYSGLYICMSEGDIFDYEEQIVNAIHNKEFISYVKNIGKYKNGGYYTFSSRDLENWLNYYIFALEKKDK